MMSFVDVAIHETGHALGFVSGADGFGGFGFTSLDLFRFQRTERLLQLQPGHLRRNSRPRRASSATTAPDDEPQ